MFELQQLKFYHDYVNDQLPALKVQQPLLQYEKQKYFGIFWGYFFSINLLNYVFRMVLHTL